MAFSRPAFRQRAGASYDEAMSDQAAKAPRRRRLLFVVLGAAVAVLLIAVAIVVVPILTHQSAGGSGQAVPTGYVSESEAVGEDGRTRTLSVETSAGKPADLSQVRPGSELLVHGTGYDSTIGIYVSICLIPEVQGTKPTPCLGGLPEGAMEGEAAGNDVATTSVWITDDWAWRAFASTGYEDSENGEFSVRILVPPAVQEGLDCTVQKCAISTRADHTAATDRVQDMLLPVAFAG